MKRILTVLFFLGAFFYSTPVSATAFITDLQFTSGQANGSENPIGRQSPTSFQDGTAYYATATKDMVIYFVTSTMVVPFSPYSITKGINVSIWSGGNTPESGIKIGGDIFDRNNDIASSTNVSWYFENGISIASGTRFWIEFKNNFGTNGDGASGDWLYQSETTGQGHTFAHNGDCGGGWNVNTFQNTSSPNGCNNGRTISFSLLGFGNTTQQLGIFLPSVSTTNDFFKAYFQCPDWGILTPLCTWTLWLVVPSQTAFQNDASTTINLLQTKFPFSYVLPVQQEYQTAMNETSSTPPHLVLDLSGTVSTTTSFGAFMPSATVLFASSTVRQYAPDAVWTTLQFLMGMIVYVGTIEMIYHGILNLIHPTQNPV